MLTQQPEVAGTADGCSADGARDLVGGIPGLFLEVDLQLVDLDRLKAREADLQPLIYQQFRELWQLEGEPLPMSAGILGDPVVGHEQKPLLGLRQPMQHNGRN